MAFYKYAGEARYYPQLELAVTNGAVADFGASTPPADGRWTTDAGPATVTPAYGPVVTVSSPAKQRSGLAASRPSASAYGEGPWYSTDTDSHDWSDGSSWTTGVGTRTYATKANLSSPATFRPLVVDYDVNLRATSSNIDIIRYTASTRRRAVIVNNGTDTLNISEGTYGSSVAPAPGGYTPVPPGQQWETASTLPIFGYFTTTPQTARVYVEIGA